MATASIPHDERQPIPVVDPVQPVAVEPDNATKLLAFFDAALALPGYHSFTLFAADAPEAEFLLRLWASAKSLPLEDRTTRYDADRLDRGPYSIRVIEVRLGPVDRNRGHVKVQFAAVYTDAPDEVREPVPGIVIRLADMAPTASQDAAVIERAQPRDLDDAAVRFGLLEID